MKRNYTLPHKITYSNTYPGAVLLKKPIYFSLFLLLFTCSVTFAQLQPKINVLQGTTNITSSSTFDIGTAQKDKSSVVVFTISNTGTAPLVLTGSPSVLAGGTNASEFVVTQPAVTTIGLASATTFSVTFTPTATGSRTATLTIANNDSNDGTFLINLTGAGSDLTTPKINSVTVGTDEVELKWNDNNTNEKGYAIYRTKATDPNVPPTPGTFSLLFETQANVTGYIDIGLKSKTVYIYKIQAIANTGTSSAFSDTAIAITPGDIPVSPSNLNALTLSQTEIQIEWKDNAINESGHAIFRSATGNPGSYNLIANTNANESSYIDQNLDSKTTYHYKIRSFSTDGYSPFTSAVSTTTLSNAPTSPTNLTAVPVSESQLQLDWTDESSNETGFIIARTVYQFGTFLPIDTVVANVTTYIDSSLVSNTSYFYYVIAFNNDGLSDNHTNVATEKTAAVPLVPTNVQLTAKDFQTITVTWDVSTAPSTAREATGYKVEVANILGINPVGRQTTFANGRTSATNEDDLIYYQVGTTDATTHTLEATNLTANQKYIFRVRAYNGNGNSPYSTEASVTTLVDASKSAPSAPSNLVTESVSQTEIDLTWQDNSSNELIFKIERQLSSETTWTEIGQVVGGTTNFSSLGLMTDSVYNYRVRASNEGGDSDYTNIDSSKVECNLIALVTNNSGGTTICSGKTSLLKITTNVTDAIYQWKRNGISITNANLPIYNASQTGEYSCQIIAGDCRKSSSVPAIVIVSSGFDVTIKSSTDSTQTMEASVQGAQGYQWYKDYALLKGATSSSYQPVTDGTYFVVVTNNGCSATSNLISIATVTTGVSESKFAKSIKLSPNPTPSHSLLEMTNNVFGQYKILITDLQGKVQMALEGVKQKTTLKKKLPVQHLAPGIYVVKVQMKDQEGVQKLVKE